MPAPTSTPPTTRLPVPMRSRAIRLSATYEAPMLGRFDRMVIIGS